MAIEEIIKWAPSIAAIFITVGVPIAIWQLIEMKRARFLEASHHLFAELDDNASRECRRFIYTELPSDPKKVNRTQLDKAENVWVCLNRIAIRVEKKLFPKSLALEMYSGTVIRCWKKLKNHIEYQRKLRNDEEYMKPFERFFEECKRYKGEDYEKRMKYFRI